MKRILFLAAPVLAVGVLIWGCSSNDSTAGDRQRSSIVNPTDLDVTGTGGHHGDSHDGGMGDHMDGGMGGNHGGMDGHHGDMEECDPDSCTCADHETCGGMMGGGMGDMECDPDCPGCGAHCDGMDGEHDQGSHHESTQCVDQGHGNDGGHGHH